MRAQNLLAFVIAALCASCSRNAPGKVEAAVDRTPTVAAVRAERHDLARSTELSAEFRPYQEVDLHAKVAGYLKYITVDVGDHVTQGQLLGELEVPESAEELAQATATERRSQLDVVRARTEVERAQSAYDIQKISYDRLAAVSKARPKLIAQQEIDSAAYRLREAQAQLATANAALASLEQQVQVTAASSARVRTMLTYLRIAAPFSGVVTKRFADPGAMIQAGTASQTQAMPVVRIAQTNRLRLVLPVPESIVPRIHLGTPVEVRADSLQRVFQGKVSRFTGQLNSSTRTMDTEVDIANTGGTIVPGMYGYASLVLDSRSDTLAVPIQALAGHGSATPTVMVINKLQQLEERQVRIGMETADLVEIASGLAENELVLIGSRSGLQSGQHVKVKMMTKLGSAD